MKVFDCFTFFNEEEMLKLRLNIMNDYVDYFIIVEASQTFTGVKKPFYSDLYSSWIDNFKNKIIKVKIDFNNEMQDSWEREFFQRNKIVEGLSSAEKNDLILISDVDEIINTSILEDLKKIKKPVQLDNVQYFWNFHWQAPKHCNQGARPVACKKRHLKKNSPQELRAMQLDRINKAGWHFSYLLEKDDIVKKIESFAHTEYNKEEYKSAEKILFRINNGIDPFDRFPLKYYEIDKTFPKYIQDNFN